MLIIISWHWDRSFQRALFVGEGGISNRGLTRAMVFLYPTDMNGNSSAEEQVGFNLFPLSNQRSLKLPQLNIALILMLVKYGIFSTYINIIFRCVISLINDIISISLIIICINQLYYRHSVTALLSVYPAVRSSSAWAWINRPDYWPQSEMN